MILQIGQAIVQMRAEIIVLFDDRLNTFVVVHNDELQELLVEVVLSIEYLRERGERSSAPSSMVHSL